MADTLESICAQCSNLLNPRLDFIPGAFQREREIIIRDLRELVSAARMDHEKTVVILAGCIFESLLYVFLQRPGPFTFRREQSLGEFAYIFGKYFREVATIPDFVVEYRNLIHMNRELKSHPDICRDAAPEMLLQLDLFVGRLALFAE